MTRTRLPSRARRNPAPDAAPLDDVLKDQVQWWDQVLALQTTWLTSCLALQAAYWRHWTTEPQQLPAWMIWHNGTEQLG